MDVAVRRRETIEEPCGSVLVYRDRIAPRSEALFLRRQYIGFRRLTPRWVGCSTDVGLADVGVEPVLLGRPGPLGVWDRVLFKQLGILPPEPDLGAYRPSVVHAQFGKGGAFALPIARALQVPLAVTFHGGDATKQKHYTFLPTVFRRRLEALKREAALVVCVSQFIRDKLAARGFPTEKLRVIRLGVELPNDDPAPRTEASPPQIVFVGRFVEKKGISHLVAAARQLAGQGQPVRLLLIGDGPLMAKLRRKTRDLPDVTFTGWIPNEEVRRHIRSAAAVCVPSIAAQGGDMDGLPTVILEAMADGVPVIGSDLAGIGEAVQHGKTGLLVPPASRTALAEAIRSIVTQPGWREELGRAGRRLVRERFDAYQQSRLLEQTLVDIAREHRVTV